MRKVLPTSLASWAQQSKHPTPADTAEGEQENGKRETATWQEECAERKQHPAIVEKEDGA
jgi:hypothetical protein